MNLFIAGILVLIAATLVRSWWLDRDKRAARDIVPYSKLAMYVDERGQFYSVGEHLRTYRAHWKLSLALFLLVPILAFILWG